MLGHFDENDSTSFYYADLTFEEAKEALQGEEQGVFLVRNSTKPDRAYVVCLKEGSEVSQYPVEKKDGALYVRQEHPFKDLPSLLSFYKRNLFATSPLIRPLDPHKLLTSPKRNTVLDPPVTVRPPPDSTTKPRGVSAPPIMDGPVYARVIKERIPISYETSALPLHVGEIIRVSRRHNGRGTGELISSGKEGNFPLTHVELVEKLDEYE